MLEADMEFIRKESLVIDAEDILQSTPSPALQDAVKETAMDIADIPRNKVEEKPTFFEELQSLINRHSVENGSNTPDFILAKYMFASLTNWEDACKAREKWYCKEMSI